MDSTQDPDLRPAAEKNIVPVIDRMMEILAELEQRIEGVSITELTVRLRQPRSSIYRILNTLERHGMVRRDAGGIYVLGSRLLGLAARVAAGASEVDLPAAAQPVLNRLAEDLGEGVKLSVVDGPGLLVIATAQGRREYALTVRAGQRLPLHVGGAGKVLMASLPEPDRRRFLGPGAEAPEAGQAALAAELDRIRREGWARDRGEQAPSIHAVAFPVTGRDGTVAAALSVPFLAGADEARVAAIRAAAQAAAAEIGARLKGA